MTRAMLAAILSGATAGVMLLLASAVVAIIWKRYAIRIESVAPAVRAPLLAALRLSPAVFAALSAVLTVLAFVRYEPADTREPVGVLLPVLALVGLMFAVAGLLRAGRGWLASTKSVRTWRASASTVARDLPVLTIDALFPIVAVVGIWRPRIYVARQVITSCDGAELDAMIAHEAAHVNAGDNVTRLLFLAAPLVPFMSKPLTEIEHAWIAAAEEAADDAARHDEKTSLALASALTKVARLASGRAPLLHVSAILSGSGIEHRVRRLLMPAPQRRNVRLGLAALSVVVPVTLVVLSPMVSRAMYDLAEYCVRYLP